MQRAVRDQDLLGPRRQASPVEVEPNRDDIYRLGVRQVSFGWLKIAAIAATAGDQSRFLCRLR